MEDKIFLTMQTIADQHWWFVARRKILATIIATIANGRQIKIFDVGCGNGDNLPMLSGFGELVALEKDDTALKNALDRKIGMVHKGALPDAIPALIGKDHDLIVMLDVLEHIEADEDCLRNMQHFLKQEGRLLITVPDYPFLWSRHDDLHHHKRRYCLSQLKKKMADCGWNVEYSSYFNTFLFPLALLDRLLEKMIGSKQEAVLKMPHNMINILFKNIFLLERFLLGKISFPFGLSILLYAKKTCNDTC